MQTMVCQRVGSVIVLVHGPESPTQAEWDKYLELVEQSSGLATQVLVYSKKGAPGPKQRADVQRLYNGYPKGAPPVAVVTGDTIARGVVKAISWIYGGDKIRAFAPEEVELALEWLKLDKRSLGEVRSMLPALKLRVGA
jgi:hypothetical protein